MSQVTVAKAAAAAHFILSLKDLFPSLSFSLVLFPCPSLSPSSISLSLSSLSHSLSLSLLFFSLFLSPFSAAIDYDLISMW